MRSVNVVVNLDDVYMVLLGLRSWIYSNKRQSRHLRHTYAYTRCNSHVHTCNKKMTWVNYAYGQGCETENETQCIYEVNLTLVQGSDKDIEIARTLNLSIHCRMIYTVHVFQNFNCQYSRSIVLGVFVKKIEKPWYSQYNCILSIYIHYLTELKILKLDFFKSYDVSNVTPLGKPVVKEFYIRLCPHK